MVWKSLKMPKNFQKTEVLENGRRAKFEIEALERGWGTTIGNALRRALLSSIQGAAIVSVKIDKVVKEYANIPGVREDVTDIILNLKSIRVKLLSDKDEVLRLDVSGNGDVSAKDIDANPAVVILNPETHIATLSGDNASLCIEMKVSSGRGYVPADDPDRRRAAENAPVGEILIDANYNPVLNVAMYVSDTRVEERTDFNRLELDITTDGSIDPEDALAYAAKLLIDHLEIFVNFEGDLDDGGAHGHDIDDGVVQKLLLNVDDLELSVRSSNCLRQAGIRTIAELVRHKENDMLKHKNFGRKSLIELNELLSSMGLSFGMDVDAYLKEGNAE